VVYKLVAARSRDLEDIRSILLRRKDLDLAYLRGWAQWWEEEGSEGILAKLESLLRGS